MVIKGLKPHPTIIRAHMNIFQLVANAPNNAALDPIK